MNAFLKYSLDKQRKIRVMLLLDGTIVQKNVTVLSLTATHATLKPGTGKTPVTVPLADILSCDYARGDHGEDE
ncbi:MAG TPA: hypothetical protein PK537_09485 [Candidatus Limiplasma sp.]|nr:hypothetical protein [Candidatus Limiplasma sp.]